MNCAECLRELPDSMLVYCEVCDEPICTDCMDEHHEFCVGIDEYADPLAADFGDD